MAHWIDETDEGKATRRADRIEAIVLVPTTIALVIVAIVVAVLS